MQYDPGTIEAKWQDRWEQDKTFYAVEDEARPKFANIQMYPYPSGVLHMGHLRNYTYVDVMTRFKRMQGFNVLAPMGWDSFGLPAENAAIDAGVHPRDFIEQQIAQMKVQLRRLGAVYDWSRELASHEPAYYRWDQWLFLQLWERGLAYKANAPVNWCPKDQTVLANEQVVEGLCERCDTPVVRRDLDQWFFKITEYADRLLPGDSDLEEWPPRVRTMQQNWIGRSEGVSFQMAIAGRDEVFDVFTTRPDTTFGMTFAVLAPEHPLVDLLLAGSEHEEAGRAFVAEVTNESDIDRLSTDRPKKGFFLGVNAVNPINGAEVPLYTADYVLMGYGTGAIMAVPGQDQRDWEFAVAHDIEIIRTVQPPEDFDGEAYTGDGVIVNSDWLDGLDKDAGIAKSIEWFESREIGTTDVKYRLRDWLISRQRYWGAPIPMISCPRCGLVPVPESELPVLHPDVEDYQPKGQSPLAAVAEFVNVDCPSCGGPAKRETDTMDTFVDSSWYFLRYSDPHNESAIFDPEKVKYWMPVDLYVGGVEHAVLHLLYARFIVKVLADMGLVTFSEPFLRMFTQGMITKDGAKMSKSKGNVVSPDPLYDYYGADAVRLYELFIGPATDDAVWTDRGVEGTFRFLKKVWRLGTEVEPVDRARAGGDRDVIAKAHRTLRKVGSDIERFHFNTAVAALMELSNTLNDYVRSDAGAERETFDQAYSMLLKMLAPLAPHMAHELWEMRGGELLANESWPDWDPDLVIEETVTMVIQISGKVRARLEVASGIAEDEAISLALSNERIVTQLDGVEPKRIIARPPKLVNIVV
ncbi:MAG: leucine--tRNA ligase [Acidimicrobiia bacterium]|nr:leucine--tRNA ligase [Acidimicrobiia bacterium]